MGLNERTPLRGSEEHVPYVFMTDPNRAYKKKVRQLQCYICSAILGVFALALLVSVAYSYDTEGDEGDDILSNDSLALKAPLSSIKKMSLQSGVENDIGVLPSSKPVYEESEDHDEPSSSSPNGLKSCYEEDNTNSYCPLSKYRSRDGFCNNLNHPYTWGLSVRPMKRLLEADYCDGVSEPRCSSLKSKLPSASTISSKLIGLEKHNRGNNNLMSSLWGQFVYQDLVAYSEYSPEAGFSESCCNNLEEQTETCYPIRVSETDPHFHLYKNACISYERTPGVNCGPKGQKEQLNIATSYLDGSVIYGSTQNIEKKIRRYENGELVLYITPRNNFVPVDSMSNCNETGQCEHEVHGCIIGDTNFPSINQMFTKHHNSIASQLKAINPQWTDETLYQESRKIVIAQIQHITYNEFLGNIIETNVISMNGLQSDKEGYYKLYDGNVDATVSNEFANAVFRIVYGIIPENNLFPQHNEEAQRCNLNMVSQLIQRGRDHGIPSYAMWREFCGLKKPSNFDDLADIMSIDSVKSLKELYLNVEDIDLFVGAFAEKPSGGGVIGPVGSCIITDQFKRLRTGDRFWHETSENPQLFSKEQLAEIRKTTLSRIICDHSEVTKTIQYNIMKTSDDNPSLLCSAIPSLNLTLWDDSNNIESLIHENNKQSVNSFSKLQKSPNKKDDISTFMNSANAYILKSSSKSDLLKQVTSFMVDIANITVRAGGNIVYEDYYKKMPITMPLDSVADTTAYTPSAAVSFSATYEDDILEGTVSLPFKHTDTFQKGNKSTLEVKFAAGITIKWGGTMVITPKKKYNCKIMFQSYGKLSLPTENQNKLAANYMETSDESEQCNILLVGTFYHRPFYCPITPWWCSEGMIFYWSGDAKIILSKPAPPVPQLKLKSTDNRLPTTNLGKSGIDIEIIKTFASVTVLKGKISGQFNGENSTDIFNGSPPIDINLNNLVNSNAYDTSTEITWTGTPIEDRLIEGTFTLPYFPTISSDISRRKLTGNFSIDVIYKYGGSINIIDPTKTYKCKLMFQEKHKKKLETDKMMKTKRTLGPITTIKGKTPFGDSCTITVSGLLSKEKIFHWSGDVELALKHKYNKTTETDGTNQFILDVPSSVDIKELSPKNNINNLGKTDNAVVQKTFASVTVLGGKVSGQFNGEDVVDIFNGSPPVDIYLDNYINPNSADTSLEATWKATPIEDSSIVGTFSVPYYPSAGQNIERRKFMANFTVNVIYKYGGSIGIIDPAKTYTCKVMFQAPKKASNNKIDSVIDPSKSVAIKNKTPFGESCSITISGSFYEPSVFCYLTPWWCSKEKIFTWHGDIELALKYKYNETETVHVESSQEKMTENDLMPVEKLIGEENFCCGHRVRGNVISGWIKANTGGIFSSAETIWPGTLPFEVRFPIFWRPAQEDEGEGSDVYGHAVVWSASIFHSTIQGSYSFPQYVGHETPTLLNWINGKFFFQLQPNSNFSLYDLIVPGVKYNSNLHFHNMNNPDTDPFAYPKRRDPTEADISYGIRAPVILLGKYTSDHKGFIWNGTFIMDLSKTTKDLTYG